MKKALLLFTFMVFLYIVGVYLISLLRWYTVAIGGLFVWFGLLALDDLLSQLKYYLISKKIVKELNNILKELETENKFKNKTQETTEKIINSFHTKSTDEMINEIKHGK